MRKKTLLWLSAGALLVLLGGAIFFGALVAAKFDFLKFSTSIYEDKIYEITEDFASISVLATTADIAVVPTDGTARVECHELKNVTHTVAVKDGVLTVEEKDTRAWYEHIGIAFGSQRVTVYLPEGLWQALTVRASTSDVRVSGLTFGAIDVALSTGDVEIRNATCTGAVTLEADTGDVELENVTCAALLTKADTGDLAMERVIVSGELTVERDTGDVELEACDAATIRIKTSTGDVEGTFLTDKTFVVQTSTGQKRVPQGTSGGLCEITTSTGDIEIRIGSYDED